MSDLFKKIVLFLCLIMYGTWIGLECCESYFSKLDGTVEIKHYFPRINLNGDISNMVDKKDERVVEFSYSYLDTKFTKYIEIKVQGSSSLKYDKKNYTIKLYEDKECKEKYKHDFGWGSQNKYVLKANWIDKTHSRNIVSARLVASANKKYGLFENTPNYSQIDGFFVEVYNNDEYLGLYTLNIPKDKWTYGLDDNNPNHLAFEAEIVNNETLLKKEVSKYSSWSLEVGKENQENLEKLNRVIRFLNNSSDEEFVRDFSNYFDIDAVLNYYVLADVLLLKDNYAKNMMLITYDGNIWYPVLYDLDTSFGSSSYGSYLYDSDYPIELDRNNLFKRFKNNFSDLIKDRYFELREEILTYDNIVNQIDLFIEKRLPIFNMLEQNRWGAIPGYDTDQMKSFMKGRFVYLDDLYGKKKDK